MGIATGRAKDTARISDPSQTHMGTKNAIQTKQLM